MGNFFAQPVIRQRLSTKATGMVMDFLLLTKRKTPQACTVLDVPVDNEEAFRTKLLDYVNRTANSGFRYDCRDGMARIVFTGTPEATAELMKLLSIE